MHVHTVMQQTRSYRDMTYGTGQSHDGRCKLHEHVTLRGRNRVCSRRVIFSYGDISHLLDEAVIAAGILLSFRWNTQNVVIAYSWSRIWEQEFIYKHDYSAILGRKTEQFFQTKTLQFIIRILLFLHWSYRGKTSVHQLASCECGFYALKIGKKDG